MPDLSSPSGLPGDGRRRDITEGPGRTRPASARSGPRHLAAPGGDGVVVEADDDHEPGPQRGNSILRTTLEWLVVIACGVVIALLAQALFIQAFWIPSPSMVPTLERGDRVLVNKLAYKTHDVRHGDVIVFERPPEASPGDDDIKDLIKRVVAVGGDTIEGVDGAVYVNGERIEEPYLPAGTPTNDLPRQEIPEGQVFVMGDNRTNSEDSRVFGPIDEDTIVGRAFVIVLPFGHVGWL